MRKKKNQHQKHDEDDVESEEDQSGRKKGDC